MSANPPPLPPPPAWPPSSQPAVPQWSPPPENAADDRPPWRDGHAGWALIHLAIGVGVWVAGLFAAGVVLAIAGRTSEQLDASGDGAAGTFLLSLAGAICGWLLFAYLRGSAARRWTAFGVVAGGTWLVMVAAMLADTR